MEKVKFVTMEKSEEQFPRIRWECIERALGNGDELLNVDAMVSGFAGDMFCDDELWVKPSEYLRDFDYHADVAVTEQWEPTTTKKIPIGLDGCEWQVFGWQGKYPEQRVELWTDGGGFVAAFQQGMWFCVVACVSEHPCVVTNKFQFHNSDGSTNDTLAGRDAASLPAFLRAMRNMSLDFMYHQCH